MKFTKVQKIMQNSEPISNGVEIRNLTKTTIDTKLLHKIARPLTKGLGLSVVLVGPKRAQELNTIYRKKTYVPNVLSFDYGEMILCPTKIRKDARKYGIVFEQELERVFRHGLLHILGYSHREMLKSEARSTKFETNSQ